MNFLSFNANESSSFCAIQFVVHRTHLYVNFLSKFTRPGDPSAAAKVGQNFCHRNAVKCGFVCTFFGSAVVSVRMHSVK